MRLPSFRLPRRIEDAVAAAIGGVDQRIIPVGVEQRAQRMRRMMVVEEDVTGAEPVVGQEPADVEHPLRLAEAPSAEHAEQVPVLALAHIAESECRGIVVALGIVGAGQRHGVDLLGPQPRLVEAFRNRLHGHPVPVALDPRRPLERDRGDQAIVVEQRCEASCELYIPRIIIAMAAGCEVAVF